jgi:hypothetical protein
MFQGQGDVWVYDLKLDESEVPLDDHLIVDVGASDSKRILRMSFSLHDIWTVSRILHLRRVVFSLIKFNAGLVENMKYDKGVWRSIQR